MSDLQSQIKQAADEFATKVLNLSKQAAVSAFEPNTASAVTVIAATPAKVLAPKKTTTPAAKKTVAAKKTTPAAARTPGAKRDPAELAKLVEKIGAHIKATPGQNAEEIGKALGLATKEMILPIKKLLATGSFRTEGQKRATRYFPKG